MKVRRSGGRRVVYGSVDSMKDYCLLLASVLHLHLKIGPGSTYGEFAASPKPLDDAQLIEAEDGK
jgi:hypothetical protein